jgi:hypothetical protein
MSHYVDSRVQKFYDEASAAKKELRRLAVDIAGWRIDHADMPVFDTPRLHLSSQVIPDVVWALENGRLDIASRIIEMVDQYNNSMGSAAMMQLRVHRELHEKAVQAHDGGDVPDYLDDEDEDPPVLRLSPEEAQAAFGPIEVEED